MMILEGRKSQIVDEDYYFSYQKKIMKRLSIFLVVCLLFLNGCSTSKQANLSSNNDEASVKSDANILIAYFTWADNTYVENPEDIDVDASTSASVLAPGNVALMAQWIQEETDGELLSIVVDEPYSSDYDECLERASDEKAQDARPNLKNHLNNIDAYDVVFLGFPNWWYTCPMAIFSFIEEYDLSNKTIIPFISHGTGGFANTITDLKEALPNSTFINPMGIEREEVKDSQDEVKQWVSNIIE